MTDAANLPHLAALVAPPVALPEAAPLPVALPEAAPLPVALPEVAPPDALPPRRGPAVTRRPPDVLRPFAT